MKIHAASRLLAETVNEYLNRLKKLKIKKLGEGAFSKVFQHPTMSDVVVKIAVKTDVGYAIWMEYCKTHVNRYCPKILDVANHKYDGDFGPSRQIVFMEKLTPLSVAGFIRFEYELGEILNLKNIDLQDPAVWLALSQQNKDKDLAQVAKFIYSVTRKSLQGNLDMHNGNLMMRGRQIVIVDPFS